MCASVPVYDAVWRRHSSSSNRCLVDNQTMFFTMLTENFQNVILKNNFHPLKKEETTWMAERLGTEPEKMMMKKKKKKN